MAHACRRDLNPHEQPGLAVTTLRDAIAAVDCRTAVLPPFDCGGEVPSFPVDEKEEGLKPASAVDRNHDDGTQ
jgi:hypothetical protein